MWTNMTCMLFLDKFSQNKSDADDEIQGSDKAKDQRQQTVKCVTVNCPPSDRYVGMVLFLIVPIYDINL